MGNKKTIDNLSRGQKAIISTITSFGLEVVNVIAALIIPRMILGFYGSEVNGLMSSITQFLGYATLLQMGVGGVIRAELYKPLAEKDHVKISKVMKATAQFFTKIAVVCCLYIIILSLIYPSVVKQSFDFFYTFFLILIIGASTAAQYFWGFPYRALVMADQKVFIYDFLQIISVLLNIIITVILILAGCSIHIVKLGSSIVFCIQPIVLKKYCERYYRLDSSAEPDNNAIKQRWNGAGYSLADFVHRNTDVFVITVFSSLKLVSVYSIYSTIYNGVNSIITMCTNSFGAAIGDMIAKKETDVLNNTFKLYEFITHVVASIVYAVAMVMIIPFIRIYTEGITDVNYVENTFAIVILTAELMFCLRQPYQTVVTSAGHFRQTQKGAYIEAVMNIVISIFLVSKYGLIGVAIGTLVSMIYRTLDLMAYVKKYLLSIAWTRVIKRYLISFVSIVIPVLILNNISIVIDSFISWFFWAIIWGVLISIEVIFLNWILYRKEFFMLKNKIIGILLKNKHIRNR